MKKKILAIGLVVCMLVVAIGSATMAYFTDTEEVVENVMTVGKVDIYMDEEFNEDLPLLPNVEIEKLVEVENRGTVDAYVRVLLAVEDTWDITNKATITYTDESNLTKCAQTVIDGALYTVYEYVYPGKLAAGASFTSLESILWNKELTQEEAAILGESFNVLVMAQAVQAEGVADNAADALDTAFAPVDDVYAAELFGGIVPVICNNVNALASHLTADKENIAVVLKNNAAYDVAAWENNAMGGDSTKSVTIIGAEKGIKLTFNQKDSDWDNVVTKNDAKLVLTGLELTSSGYNDGPWNRHDINFACPVVMTCVESNKAFAFKNSADLTNVKISDANNSDTYAIWISPRVANQTVTLDGVVIDMIDCKDGRGIKIDNQYVDAADEQIVTLNVTDTTIKTEEKGAILVKTTVGANINLDNVDIRKVAADPVYPVWVDKDAEAYAHLVKVNGVSVIVEPVTDAASLWAALEDGETNICVRGVEFTENNFTGHYYKDRNIDFVDCTFTANMNYMYINNATYTNCTFNSGSENAAVHYDELFGDLVFNNCNFVSGKVQIGANAGMTGTVTFNDCTFAETASTSIWAEKGIRVYSPAVFSGCEFNNRVVLAGSNNLSITFDSCTMNGGAPVYYVDNTDGIIRGGNIPAVTVK